MGVSALSTRSQRTLRDHHGHPRAGVLGGLIPCWPGAGSPRCRAPRRGWPTWPHAARLRVVPAPLVSLGQRLGRVGGVVDQIGRQAEYLGVVCPSTSPRRRHQRGHAGVAAAQAGRIRPVRVTPPMWGSPMSDLTRTTHRFRSRAPLPGYRLARSRYAAWPSSRSTCLLALSAAVFEIALRGSDADHSCLPRCHRRGRNNGRVQSVVGLKKSTPRGRGGGVPASPLALADICS